jgi:hypothetical protein
MKNIIMSVVALTILASCQTKTVEPTVEETVVDTTVVVEEEVLVEEVEVEGEVATQE